MGSVEDSKLHIVVGSGTGGIQSTHLGNVEEFLFNFDRAERDRKAREGQTGRWTPDEHRKYVQVIRLNLPKRELQRRLVQHITTRTDSQIRAHHQKMLKKYKTLEDIAQTDVVDVPGMKEIVPKLDRIINILRSVTNEAFGLAPTAEDPFLGVRVVEDTDTKASFYMRH